MLPFLRMRASDSSHSETLPLLPTPVKLKSKSTCAHNYLTHSLFVPPGSSRGNKLKCQSLSVQPNLGVVDSHKIVPAVLRAVHRLYGKESVVGEGRPQGKQKPSQVRA